ncbi:ABC transporter permease [Cupriavidus taiwanensis]|uniref:Transport permease protein n=1 Tax=Cupriavidus taiwanensis TaxID=164546 RepID=A0A375CFJ9_9BURK|nr:ABC transporter permease [Cupriavidus taiwanensis]SOY69034.1 ABC-2 type transport system permease protein, LPS efflux transporter [Cupriavidus taiwanensis]SOZ28340.1 ABC-2 type transport system permease protein, LPS efflux transporter [Cupriavidus taiwanensis]SPA33088.1 ABC-2 type transport system permease protein, LPS efflux transporter [Cupriavidus taiwanensis]
MARRQALSTILLFARQELVDRQQGQLFGMAWLMIHPLCLIIVFSTVFSHLMRARLGSDGSPYAYTVYLIGGMLAWNLFANTLSRLSTVYTAKAHLIRKVPVSLGLMPLHVVAVELAVYGISMALYAAYLAVIGFPFSTAWLALPAVIGLLGAFAYGVGIVLGMLEVFLPDVRNIVAVALQFGFWMTPVVYLPEILPPWARALLMLNPAYWAIDAIHLIILGGRLPAPAPLAALALLALALLLAARWMKRRLERELRDLL